MVAAQDLGSCSFGSVGSSPISRTYFSLGIATRSSIRMIRTGANQAHFRSGIRSPAALCDTIQIIIKHVYARTRGHSCPHIQAPLHTLSIHCRAEAMPPAICRRSCGGSTSKDHQNQDIIKHLQVCAKRPIPDIDYEFWKVRKPTSTPACQRAMAPMNCRRCRQTPILTSRTDRSIL